MRTLTLFAIAVSALASTTSHATNSVSTTASAGFQSAQLTDTKNYAGTCTYPAPTYQPVCTASPQQSSSAASDFNFRGQAASASAHVDGPQLLHTSAAVSSSSPPFDTLRSSANASFNDELTFNAAGLTGQSVLVFIKYSLVGTGSVARDNSAYNPAASNYLSISLGGNSSFEGGYAYAFGKSGFLSPSYSYSGYKVFSALVGTQQSIGFSINSSCEGMAMTGGFTCATNTTFSYLGISGLALPNGTEVASFSVTSKSGFDYVNASAPVPEPASGLMLLAGISAIGALRQAKQREA